MPVTTPVGDTVAMPLLQLQVPPAVVSASGELSPMQISVVPVIVPGKELMVIDLIA